MSSYGIFENKDKTKKLVFYPCPKNANSSAKLFFIKHLGLENEYIFLSDNIPRYKQTKTDWEHEDEVFYKLPTLNSKSMRFKINEFPIYHLFFCNRLY